MVPFIHSFYHCGFHCPGHLLLLKANDIEVHESVIWSAKELETLTDAFLLRQSYHFGIVQHCEAITYNTALIATKLLLHANSIFFNKCKLLLLIS